LRSHLTCILIDHGIEFFIGSKIVSIGFLNCLLNFSYLPSFKINVLFNRFTSKE